MDLTHIAQDALVWLQSLLTAVAVGAIGLGARYLQSRWHLTVSQATQSAIASDVEAAVAMGVGLGRAHLASGSMSLAHVSLGNPWMDSLGQAALNALSDAARGSGLTADDMARRILAGLGHALGDDPSVPSIAPAPAVEPAPVPVPAAAPAEPAA